MKPSSSRVVGSMPATLVGIILSGFVSDPGQSVVILTRDRSLEGTAPQAAYEGVGAWRGGEYFVATGLSTQIDSLGKSKDKSIELSLGEADAKRRILVYAATVRHRGFDEDAYDIRGELSGFRVAATYRIDGESGIFVIALAKEDEIKVEVIFNPAKAKRAALTLFDAAKYHEAARKLALLTQKGIQDDETMALARAAAWQVNLGAGVGGTARAEALNGLGQFYFKRQDFETSLQHFYDLYLETDQPDRALLEKLVVLCEQTRRRETARKFDNEIRKRFPPSESPVLSNSTIDPSFQPILLLQPHLLQNGGAGLLRFDGALYFVAVGTTEIREPSSKESLRRLRVGRVQAQKEAIFFLEQTHVVAEDRLVERTTVVSQDGQKRGEIVKTLDERTATKVHGVLNSLVDVGTWTNSERTLFFFAVGKKLN